MAMRKRWVGRRRPYVIPLDGGIDLSTSPVERNSGTMIDCLNFMARPQGGGYERFSGIARITGENFFLPSSPSHQSPVSHPQPFVLEGRLYIARVYRDNRQGYQHFHYMKVYDVAKAGLEGNYQPQIISSLSYREGGTGDYWHVSSDGSVRLQVLVTNFSGDASRQRAYIVSGGLMEPVVFDPDQNSIATVVHRWDDHDGNGQTEYMAATPQQVRDATFDDEQPPRLPSTADVNNLTEAEQEIKDTHDEWQARIDRKNALALKYENLARIQTFQQGEYPTHMARHADRIVFAYPSSNLLLSSADSPYNFFTSDVENNLTGTAVILGFGQEITGMAGDYQGGMVIAGRNNTAYLTGSRTADFQLRTLSNNSGCLPHSMQMMEFPIVLDDRGVRGIRATEVHGDLLINTISQMVRPILQRLQLDGLKPVASVAVRSRNQYRLFYPNGNVLCGTFVTRDELTSIQWTRLYLGRDIVGAVSYEDGNGEQAIYLTDAGGNIFRSDWGYDLAGDHLPFLIEFSNVHMGQPNHWKRLFRAEFIASWLRPRGTAGARDGDHCYRFRTRYLLDYRRDDELGGQHEVPVVPINRQAGSAGLYMPEITEPDLIPEPIKRKCRNVSVEIKNEVGDDPCDPFQITGFSIDYSMKGQDRNTRSVQDD